MHLGTRLDRHAFALESSEPHTPHTHHKVFLAHALTFVCQPFCETLAVDIAMSHVERAHGAAHRRRDRMVRSWWRHEQRSIAATVATMLHHSAGRKPHPTLVDAATQVGSLFGSSDRIRGSSTGCCM